MGSCVSLWKEYRVLLFGLDGSGKTAILQKLKWGNIVTFLSPTGGYNVESVKLGKYIFDVWDVGGHPTLRTVWQYHFTYARGLVFVIDGTELNRLSESLEELYRAVSDKVARKYARALLILLNKQDVPSYMSAASLEARLDKKVMANVNYRVQECTTEGHSAMGLYDGFHWLGTQMETQRSLILEQTDSSEMLRLTTKERVCLHCSDGMHAESSKSLNSGVCGRRSLVIDAGNLVRRAVVTGVREASSLLGSTRSLSRKT